MSNEFSVGFTLDENVHRLQELTKEIKELSDLVPEWKRHEAEQHEKEIETILFDLITTRNWW